MFKNLFFFLSILLSISLASCEDKDNPNPPNPPSPPEPPGETDNMEWWREARLGMFIHWGLYSVWGGVYEGIDTDGKYVKFSSFKAGTAGSEWLMKVAKIPNETYFSRSKEFNSSRFDPDMIAQLAKNAGMKYLIITTKHHEGVCLWNSKSNPINISLTSADHDVLKRLKKACIDRGLKFGIYYSQALDWSAKGGFGQEHHIEYTPEEHEEYVDKYVLPAIDELLEELDPDLFWYDAPFSKGDDNQALIKGLADKIYLHMESKKKAKLIVNDRLSEWHLGDFGTGEIEFYQGDRDGENCNSLFGAWGYGPEYEEKGNIATPQLMIFTYVIGCVSRGQNALINIGPRGDGSITNKEINALNILSTWMKENGEAVHGCTRVLTKSNPQWGRLTMNKKTNKIYLTIGTRDQSIYLDGISTKNLKKVTTVAGLQIEYQVIADDRVSIPNFREKPKEDIPVVLVAHYDGAPEVFDYTYPVDNRLIAYSFQGDGTSFRQARVEPNGNPVVAAWLEKSIYTDMKFNLESGQYNLRMNLDAYSGTPTYTLTVTDKDGKKQTSNSNFSAGSIYFTTPIELKKDVIYTVSIEKARTWAHWSNVISLEFVKK